MRKSVEIDINNSPHLSNAIAKLSEAAAQAIRLKPRPQDKESA